MSCAPSWTEPEDVPYNIFIFTFGFFIPLITIIITSAIVLITVKHTYKNISNMSIKNSAISKQQKVIKMVMILQIFFISKLLFCQIIVLLSVFLFCWSPYAALSMMGILGQSKNVPLILTVLPLQLAKSAVIWNPVIYVIMNPMVRNYVDISKTFLATKFDPTCLYKR